MEKATQSNRNNNPSSGLLSWISRRGFWLLFVSATLLAIAATWMAAEQKPHPDAFRVTAPWHSPAAWFSADFWLYPYERNAFKRLPVIRSDLNDVFVLGERVWAVGEGGLIIHSPDGGVTWQQQRAYQLEPLESVEENPQRQRIIAPEADQQLESNAQGISRAEGGLPDIEKRFRKNLQSIFFIDAQRGWAVGESDMILSTADGGKSWQPQASGTEAWLYSVTFIDAQRGWTVGTGGTILSTADGGKSWQPQASGTEALLFSVTFMDAQRGWTVGSGGKILSTVDGGKSWQPQASGTKAWFSSVTFIDAQRGWAVGELGVILSTSDGGKSWQPQASGTEAWLESVTFMDAQRGWAVGRGSTILSTTDGGKSWQPQTSGTEAWLFSVTFFDAQRGWAVGLGGTILSTADGGKSWQPQASGTAAWFSSVTFIDAQRGWAVGWSGTILSTVDGGQSWRPQASDTEARLFSVTFIDAQRGWAVGRGGTILSTADGGKSWQPQTSGTEALLFSVTFFDAQRGWAVGLGGTILSTADGGKSWQLQASGTDARLHSVTFFDVQRGWAVGDDGMILSTADGGKSWQPQTSGTEAWLFSVTFFGAQRGWAVGEDGTILSTADGGKSWQREASGTEAWLYSVTFIGAQRGWAVGEGGTILSTVDGGKSWQLQASGTDARLHSVTFIDAQRGWAVGRGGTILSTADGGKSWQDVAYHRYPAPRFYLALLLIALGYAAAFGLRARQNRQAQRQPASIANLGVSDQPAGPGRADLVGARQVALGLTRFLTNENTQPPLTIAITGEWGSGKSSVMNYLFANLKRKGLRPVWFNAWHHREEQNVLASILTNIHQQAIRPWWQPAGLWFRMRMLWRRHWLWKLATLLTLLSTAFMLTWLMMTPDKWKDTLRYLRFVISIEQPVVFSERGFNQLCGNWAADQKHAGPSDAALIGGLLSGAWVTPRRKPENNPVDKTVAQNIVQAHAQQKADFFSAQECTILHALHSQQRVKRNELNCRDERSSANDDQSCYVSPRVFLKIAEQKLGATLTHLDEQAIIAALENLSPESPVPFTREVVSLVTALFAALAFFVFKGMTLLGFAPVQMMQGILKQSGMVAQPGEKVGARQLFEKHFRRITGLLGRRRLVLFIDDLDRCDREHTRQVLEMTNFLSSSGELFIVLGMAPRYVLANVTLSYKDLAQAVHEADRLGGHAKANSQESSPGQSWFARHYLQKLIHIEVPVPKPETAQVMALLSFDGKTEKTENDLEREEQRELHVDRFLGYVAKVMRILLLLGAVGAGVYYGDPDWHKAGSVSTGASAVSVSSGAGAAEVASEKTVAAEVRAQPNEPGDGELGAVFKAGVDYFDSRPLWIGLAAIAAFAGFGLLLFWAAQRLSRVYGWLDSYPLLVWLKPLLHRLKVMLIDPESTQDSQSFVDALRIWHPLIALKSPTPRTVKAFVNRLRYMASRGDFAAEAHHEAQMVALATIDYCYENNVDELLALMTQYLAEESGSPKTQFEARWPDLASTLSLHVQAFGAYPSAQDIAFYQAMNADICIHRQE